ncbi:MAG: mobile mystery protein B [Planctomycetia bacterium]|nr:mobile mystery protein B [Planctomycetia bacterium]
MAAWMTTLPGETPLDDLSGLKIKGITTRSQLNEVEAKNILKAVIKYLARKPSRIARFTDFKWYLRLHEEMFGEVWDWAGKLRTRNLNLGVNWQQVQPALFTLLGDLPAWGEYGTPIIEQAAMLHHRAVSIHPFMNGNGRWSRMLANVWLKLNDEPPTAWPEETIGSESTVRASYLAAIRNADQGDYCDLINLHINHAHTG